MRNQTRAAALMNRRAFLAALAGAPEGERS